MQRHIQRRLVASIVIALLALVSACSDDDNSATTPSGGSHNDADVSFATGMISHHSQAIEMADMALSQARSSAIVELASQIKAAQDPEIETMTGWLESWGEPIPDTETGEMDGMDGMDGDTMPGMMTDDDMEHLGDTSGAEFERLWLTMMTEHHQGAIEMSETELADGEFADAKALAQDIIDGQTAEIGTMQGLLDESRN